MRGAHWLLLCIVHCIIEIAVLADISFVIALPFIQFTSSQALYTRTRRFPFVAIEKPNSKETKTIKFSHCWKFYAENMNFMRMHCEQQINKAKEEEENHHAAKKSWRTFCVFCMNWTLLSTSSATRRNAEKPFSLVYIHWIRCVHALRETFVIELKLGWCVTVDHKIYLCRMSFCLRTKWMETMRFAQTAIRSKRDATIIIILGRMVVVGLRIYDDIFLDTK